MDRVAGMSARGKGLNLRIPCRGGARVENRGGERFPSKKWPVAVWKVGG